MRRRTFIGPLLFLLLNVACFTQEQPKTSLPSTPEEIIRKLQERIEQMEKRISDLEAKNPQSLATPAEPRGVEATVATSSPEPATVHDHDAPPLGAEETYPNLKIRGFGDVEFGAQNVNTALNSRSGFQTGQLILHLTSALSKKITYFGEYSFTAFPTGYVLGVERTIIRYDYSDPFKASFGLFHVPTTYYNTAFHHGTWLQTTMARPAMADFRTGTLPQHFLGAAVEGQLKGSAGFGYMAGIGNGSGGFGAGDSDNNRGWFASAHVKPTALKSLRLGASIYGDKRSGAGRPFRELISSAHLVWLRETPEVMAEVSNVRHVDFTTTNRSYNSQMFYVQLAYRLPWNERKWKPYYLFDYINTPSSEPLYGTRDLVGSTVGMRYDISDFAAFKAEYRNQKRRMQDHRFEGFFLQTSFTF